MSEAHGEVLKMLFAKYKLSKAYSEFCDEKGNWKVEPSTLNKFKFLKVLEREVNEDYAILQRIMNNINRYVEMRKNRPYA